MAEPRKPDPRKPAPLPPSEEKKPEEKKILDQEFQSQALEICRQELKKMEFWAKCKEVLESAVSAESGLARKKAELEAAEKSAKEQEEAHEQTIKQQHAEAERVKSEMEKEYARKEIELKKRLDALSKSVDDVTFERDGLVKEVERLRGERLKEMDDLQKFKDESIATRLEVERAAEKEKKALNEELENTRRAIRDLKSSVARIPA